jgi:hypothetical protein
MDHPFSRWISHRPNGQAERPIKGVTTDGTEKAVRIVVGDCGGNPQSFCQSLQPGTSVAARLVDARTHAVEPGIGTLQFGRGLRA